LSEVVESIFLGLTIDKHLNWNTHVLNIIKKVSSGLFALRKMADYCNLQRIKNITSNNPHSFERVKNGVIS
jgi:hypothetical protein